MEQTLIIMATLAFLVFCMAIMNLALKEHINKRIKELEDTVNKLLPDNRYEEHCVKPLNVYTTFRVVPYFNGIKEVWDVEYRNPSDTKWKVCRCEETKDEAKKEMYDIIDRLKNGEI